MYELHMLHPDWQQDAGVSLSATYTTKRSSFVVTQRERHLIITLYRPGIFPAEIVRFRSPSSEEAEWRLFRLLSLRFPHVPSHLPPPGHQRWSLIPVKLIVVSGLVRLAILLRQPDWQLLKQAPHGSVPATIIESLAHDQRFTVQIVEGRFTLAPSHASLLGAIMTSGVQQLLKCELDPPALLHLSDGILNDPELALSEALLTWTG